MTLRLSRNIVEYNNRVYVRGHKYVLGLTQTHFKMSVRSQTHFKMSLRRALNIMPKNPKNKEKEHKEEEHVQEPRT